MEVSGEGGGDGGGGDQKLFRKDLKEPYPWPLFIRTCTLLGMHTSLLYSYHFISLNLPLSLHISLSLCLLFYTISIPSLPV